MNGKMYLSLAEIDKGLRDVLNMPELFDTKPVIMRAYQASKDKIKSQHEFGDDYVSRAEFKYTLIYLRLYYELWEDFEKMDAEGERRISEVEFVKGKDILVNEWHLKIDDASAKFKQILEKYGANAHITFTQFCDYIIGERMTQFNDLQTHGEI